LTSWLLSGKSRSELTNDEQRKRDWLFEKSKVEREKREVERERRKLERSLASASKTDREIIERIDAKIKANEEAGMKPGVDGLTEEEKKEREDAIRRERDRKERADEERKEEEEKQQQLQDELKKQQKAVNMIDDSQDLPEREEKSEKK
jgi:hypothetical protein